MPVYYCTDTQVTDLLPTLTNSQIASSAQRDSKLRTPAKEWIDSLYPGFAPFPDLATNGARGWQINQADHGAGNTTLTIDSGSGDPAVSDKFQVKGDAQIYTITAYASNVITYTPEAKISWEDNEPLMIGTPSLIQQAAAWYAVSIGYQILRNNPEDKASAGALSRAKELLRVDRKGVARAKPWPGHHMNTATARVVEAYDSDYKAVGV